MADDVTNEELSKDLAKHVEKKALRAAVDRSLRFAYDFWMEHALDQTDDGKSIDGFAVWKGAVSFLTQAGNQPVDMYVAMVRATHKVKKCPLCLRHKEEDLEEVRRRAVERVRKANSPIVRPYGTSRDSED